MKVTVSARQLQLAITEASRFKALKYVNPLLEHAHLTAQDGKLTIHSTRLQDGYIGTLSAEVDTVGSTLVHLDTAIKVLKTMDKDKDATITISADGEGTSVHLQGNGVDATLTIVKGKTPSDFPSTPSVEWEQIIRVDSKELWTAIGNTKHSISTDVNRVEYSGLHATLIDNTLHLTSADYMTVATDSISADSISEGTEPMGTINIPLYAIKVLHSILKGKDGDVYMYTDGSWVMFQGNGVAIYTRLIDRYIKTIRSLYDREYPTVITLNRLKLMKAIERAQTVSTTEHNAVHIVRGDGKITVSSLETEKGVSRGHVDTIDYVGETIDFYADAVGFTKQLKVIPSPDVTLHIQDRHFPVVIQPTDGSDAKYIIVPLNVNKH